MDDEVVDEVADSTPADEGQQPEGEQTDITAAEGTETPANDDAGAPRSKGVERRIGQLTKRYRQSEREKQELATRLEALEKRIGPTPEPERPDLTNYETPEEYEDALFEWRDSLQAHKAKDTPSVDPARAQAADKLEADLTVLSETQPDALMTVFDDDWPCSDSTYEFIANSEKGAELAYHLASNHDVAKHVDGLSPVLAARELVKIEANLASQKPSAMPPPPGEPVTPSGSSVVTDPDKMTATQWRKWREDQLRA